MKNIKNKFLFLFSFLIFSTTILGKSVSASDDLKLSITSNEVPRDVTEYAQTRIKELMEVVMLDPEYFNLSQIDNFSDYYLGEPFTIYDFSTDITTTDTYYYPIMHNKEVRLILAVVDTGLEFSCSLSKSFSEQLNQLEDKQNVLLYLNGDSLYAQSSKYNSLLAKKKDTHSSQFANLSYSEKIQQLHKKSLIDHTSKTDNEIVPLQLNSTKANLLYIPRFSTNTSTTKKLDLTGCYCNQIKNGIAYGMCWAAATATTYRYLTGDFTLYPYNVCNLMGIGYDDGGTVDDVRRALAKKGVTYYCSADIITFSKVKSEISNRKPVIITGATYDSNYAHTVAVTGYYSSTELMYYWDSASESMGISTSGYLGPKKTYTFSSGGRTYYWVNTAYA